MSDQRSIGLVFAKETPQRRDSMLSAADNRFAIPPGDPNYEVKSQNTLREDATLVSMIPHMHLRGESFEYDGTRVECTAHFDNSPNNKFNPDPRATVRFGRSEVGRDDDRLV